MKKRDIVKSSEEFNKILNNKQRVSPRVDFKSICSDD